MQATTIDEVIDSLDHIIATYRSQGSRLGYFPALYRKVTLNVKQGIEQGLFEDGARMEKLDVLFANRYLAAVAQEQRGQTPSRSWAVAFQAAQSWFPIVLQHLLLGINAHINLDLGIAAAQTAPGPELADLQQDFNAINGILAALIDDVRWELGQVWPLLKLLAVLPSDAAQGRVINFSLARAREHAWGVAQHLASLDEADQPGQIERADVETALLGQMIWRPPWRTRLVLGVIRLGERKSVPDVIDILM